MKNTQYLIDDLPLQILYLDDLRTNAQQFFSSSLGSAWFDYDLHLIAAPIEADIFLDTNNPLTRNLDLLLVASGCWFTGGEELVRKVRSDAVLADLPVYCVLSCQKKINSMQPDCANKNWRLKTGCNDDYSVTSMPFGPYLAPDHPAHIDGTFCGNNIDEEIPRIINKMAAYWFHSS